MDGGNPVFLCCNRVCCMMSQFTDHWMFCFVFGLCCLEGDLGDFGDVWRSPTVCRFHFRWDVVVGEVCSQNDFDFRYLRRRRFLRAAGVCRGKALCISATGVIVLLLISSYLIV